MVSFVITQKDNEEDANVHKSDCNGFNPLQPNYSMQKSLKTLKDNIIFSRVNGGQVCGKHRQFTSTRADWEQADQPKISKRGVLIQEWCRKFWE